ncbi:hypothetical protein R3I94_013521 [Phoxinus phoxinus]|uniref:Uncharacterized protein n=1 Tax=Phoxinus phoxinus TaxID=58324 RepID=A0AAN9CNE4_9TELE
MKNSASTEDETSHYIQSGPTPIISDKEEKGITDTTTLFRRNPSATCHLQTLACRYQTLSSFYANLQLPLSKIHKRHPHTLPTEPMRACCFERTWLVSPGRELKGKERKKSSSSLANKSEPINHRIHLAVFLYCMQERKINIFHSPM